VVVAVAVAVAVAGQSAVDQVPDGLAAPHLDAWRCSSVAAPVKTMAEQLWRLSARELQLEVPADSRISAELAQAVVSGSVAASEVVGLAAQHPILLYSSAFALPFAH
jgi:hypothetical protein